MNVNNIQYYYSWMLKNNKLIMQRIKKHIARWRINKEGLRSVWKNTSALFFIRSLGYLVPFLVFPYLTRTLGVNGFGIYAVAISLCALMLVITDFGFFLSGAHWIAKNQQNKQCVAEYLANVILIKWLLIIICCLLLVLVSMLIPSLTVLRSSILPISLLVISQSFQAEWIFQGIEKISLALYPFLIGRILFVAAIFSFVHQEDDVNLLINLLSLSNFLSLLISGYLLYRAGFYLVAPEISQIKILLKENFVFFLSRIAVSIYSSASTFIVGFSNGVQAAGIYSAAEKLYLAGQLLASPLSQALYPYLTRTGDRKLFYVMVVIFSIPLSLLCLVLIFFSKDIIVLIYGKAFTDSASILNIFLICAVVNFISANFGYPAFSAIGRISLANITVFIGGGIQLILVTGLLFANKLNGLTITFGVLFTELIVMILRIGLFFYLVRRTE